MNSDKSCSNRWYFGDEMELLMHIDIEAGSIRGFRWMYDTSANKGKSRVFAKDRDRISHYFEMDETEADMICSRMAAEYHPEPGMVPEGFITALRKQAADMNPAWLKYILKYIGIYNKCLLQPDQ